MSAAERAFSPDQVEKSDGLLEIDIDWYLTQQIHPPISRLCGPIEGTDPAQIAECLGLNPAKYPPPPTPSTNPISIVCIN